MIAIFDSCNSRSNTFSSSYPIYHPPLVQFQSLAIGLIIVFQPEEKCLLIPSSSLRYLPSKFSTPMTKVHSPSAYLLLITRPVNYWRFAGRSSKGRFAVQTVATMRWRLLLVKGGPLVRIDPDTTPVSWTILSTEPHQSCTRYRST